MGRERRARPQLSRRSGRGPAQPLLRSPKVERTATHLLSRTHNLRTSVSPASTSEANVRANAHNHCARAESQCRMPNSAWTQEYRGTLCSPATRHCIVWPTAHAPVMPQVLDARDARWEASPASSRADCAWEDQRSSSTRASTRRSRFASACGLPSSPSSCRPA